MCPESFVRRDVLGILPDTYCSSTYYVYQECTGETFHGSDVAELLERYASAQNAVGGGGCTSATCPALPGFAANGAIVGII